MLARRTSVAKRGWLTFVLAAALTASAFAFACSDDGGDDAQPTATDTAATQASATGTPGAAASETAELDPSAQELIDTASQFGSNPSKITYSYSTSSPDGDFAGTMVSYWLPPDRWRLDYDVAGQASTLIGGEGVVYLCSGTQGSGQCLEMPSDEAALPFADAIANPSQLPDYIEQQLRGVAFERSERQIAGQAATCYRADQDQDGIAEYCLGLDGTALLVSSTVEGITVILEATAVETAVSEEDFAIPYDIVPFGE